jgi:hypothetical protein
MLTADMGSPPKEQKTAILQDAPPEVQRVRANQPPAAPMNSAATMMMDAAQHPAPGPGGQQPQRQVVVPTMMRERPSGQLPQMRKPEREVPWGRWVAGPLIAGAIAAGTAFGANMLMPIRGPNDKGPLKPQGHLKLQTDPPGASVTVNGVNWKHFTPTVIDGDIGSTLHVGFTLDGYAPREADVYVTEGEHPFSVKLEAQAKQPTPAVDTQPKEHEHHHHHTTTTAAAPVKEETGEGALTIHVRPWAIVYVDGSRLRQTPVQDFKLKAGKHVIELVNEGKNRREKVNVQVKNGESQEITRDWDK